MTSKELSEVRQCIETEHPLYGAVAVRTTAPDGWGIMTTANGGHHGTNEEVSNWKVLQ